MSTAARRRKRLVILALVPLGLGGSLGFALSSLGLLPTPSVAVRWTSPLLNLVDYVPPGPSGSGEQIVLVYIGSSTCPWANLPEFPGLVRAMKTELQSKARRYGKAFGALGIARDRVAADGLKHLAKLGAFDEVLAGNGWANTGIQHFLYGDGELAGPSATPQVVLLSRRLARRAGHVSVEDERVLLRKTGFESIREWRVNGFPVQALTTER